MNYKKYVHIAIRVEKYTGMHTPIQLYMNCVILRVMETYAQMIYYYSRHFGK